MSLLLLSQKDVLCEQSHYLVGVPGTASISEKNNVLVIKVSVLV